MQKCLWVWLLGCLSTKVLVGVASRLLKYNTLVESHIAVDDSHQKCSPFFFTTSCKTLEQIYKYHPPVAASVASFPGFFLRLCIKSREHMIPPPVNCLLKQG